MTSPDKNLEYLTWYRQEAPNHFTVRGTLFRIDENGDVFAVNDTLYGPVAKIIIRQESTPAAPDKQWYEQPVTWLVRVSFVNGPAIYNEHETGTASPYDNTKDELRAHGLDALRTQIMGAD